MGIFDALNTSVAGLQAQSFALQNISGNIANAQTTGYKGVGTSFVDLVPDSTTPNRQVAGSVTAYARATISSQGTVSASTVATYMAINGDGFFSVQRQPGSPTMCRCSPASPTIPAAAIFRSMPTEISSTVPDIT